MIQMEKKRQVRTPDQMAKIAMRDLAKADLEANGYGTEVKVTIEYMGIRQHLTATPNVKVENGAIGFYCGARGMSSLNFEPAGKDRLSFGLGLNISTGFGIDKEKHKAILDRHGLEVVESTKTENDTLDAGETT